MSFYVRTNDKQDYLYFIILIYNKLQNLQITQTMRKYSTSAIENEYKIKKNKFHNLKDMYRNEVQNFCHESQKDENQQKQKKLTSKSHYYYIKTENQDSYFQKPLSVEGSLFKEYTNYHGRIKTKKYKKQNKNKTQIQQDNKDQQFDKVQKQRETNNKLYVEVQEELVHNQECFEKDQNINTVRNTAKIYNLLHNEGSKNRKRSLCISPDNKNKWKNAPWMKNYQVNLINFFDSSDTKIKSQLQCHKITPVNLQKFYNYCFQSIQKKHNITNQPLTQPNSQSQLVTKQFKKYHQITHPKLRRHNQEIFNLHIKNHSQKKDQPKSNMFNKKKQKKIDQSNIQGWQVNNQQY